MKCKYQLGLYHPQIHRACVDYLVKEMISMTVMGRREDNGYPKNHGRGHNEDKYLYLYLYI